MLRLAVDVGGTFTDLVGVEDETGRIFIVKDKSTPEAPEKGFISIIRRFIEDEKVNPSSIGGVVHVGTIGSNLFRGQLGIKIPRVALLTTKGFRDILEIGRQNRPELYNIFFQRPMPLVPRSLRFEVSERVSGDGSVEQEVSESELKSLASRLSILGVEAVAISFLNSFMNPENERRARAVLQECMARPLFISSEVDPEHREYERTSTTVVCAVLAPVMGRYLHVASRELEQMGIRASLQVFSSSGGIVDIGEVMRRPIVAIESGPAAGVVGAAELARQLGISGIISLDMGGTTAKAGSVVDYEPLLVSEIEVGGRVHMGRMVKGSGYPVRYPSIDLAEVSAGGGTIVWCDEGGALRVGPLSAGADPGPACYGIGGREPTITDANLFLGRLGTRLLGGKMMLQLRLAEEGLTRVASRLGMEVQDLASSVLKLVNLQMARAVKLVSLERGLDPRQFTLVAFGGAGPMHAAELAEEIGIGSVIIPPAPGLFSALSLLLTDLRFTYVKGFIGMLEELDGAWFTKAFDAMVEEALSRLRSRGITPSDPIIATSVDLRYYGQGYELEVAVSPPFDRTRIAQAFEKHHEAVYGFSHRGEGIELTALRLNITVRIRRPNLGSLAMAGASVDGARRGSRAVWFEGSWMPTPVFWRDLLPLEIIVDGPAIIEEYSSTVVVPPRWSFRKNRLGCLILTRAAHEER